ncbi:MAG: hypothetical protein ACYC9O_09380 [Candidatus Latescibacterota bacterium]
MVRVFCILFIIGVTVLSCASRNGVDRGSNTTTEIGWDSGSGPNPADDPAAVLKRHTVEFRIPNPLVGEGMTSNRRIDPSHESQIFCRATLLDSIATEADIAMECAKDSLDTAQSAEFRRTYLAERVQPGRFRIRISMESGFSPKSLEARHWVMYIMNARGVMIEPVQVKTASAVSEKDSIFSSYHRISLPRTRINGEITLYFDRVTFFKEDLLSKENPLIALEMAHEKKTVAHVEWKNAGSIKTKDGKSSVRSQR